MDTTFELMEVPIASIKIGERFRKEMGELSSLREDIATNGILQPITVSKCQDGTYDLCAGGRRLQCCQELGLSTIPALIKPEIEELDLRTIELAENFFRKNLEFGEEAALVEKIHELQLEKHGPKINNMSGDGWSKRDTAKLLGKSHTQVNADIELASAMREVPELFEGVKKKSDAFKVLEHAKQEIIKKELAERVQKEMESGALDKSREKLITNYLLGDFVTGVKKVQNEIFDIVEFDPPYNINLNFAVKTLTDKQASDLMSEVSTEDYFNFLDSSLAECYRVMKANSWLILWFPIFPHITEIRQLMEKNGFKTPPIPAVWYKQNPGQCRQFETLLGTAYETFFYARKGNPVIVKKGRNNVFHFQHLPGSSKVHPTERPIPLTQEILSTFAMPGSSVLVPCLGSGSTLLAASNCNMFAVGWDKSPDYRNDYIRRVREGIPGGFK